MDYGTVKTKTDKGFGFIAPENGEKDIFFHHSSLVDVTFEELAEGTRVSFDIEDSPKGARAANVRVAA